MAPEVMSGQAYDGFKADVYAFGLIIWEIITSQKLFAEFNAWKPFKAAITNGHRPPIPEFCPEGLRYNDQSFEFFVITFYLRVLLNRCWDSNPKMRPSFPEIVFRLGKFRYKIQLCVISR
jgi:serine/threonine protein kinase